LPVFQFIILLLKEVSLKNLKLTSRPKVIERRIDFQDYLFFFAIINFNKIDILDNPGNASNYTVDSHLKIRM